MSKKKTAATLPPPPSTGGTHVWDGSKWVTTQTADPSAPTIAPVEADPPPPVATPSSEA